MTDKNFTLTQEYLKEILTYDPDTGVFTRKIKTCNRVKAGDTTGSISKHKDKHYLRISIFGKNYYAHRLAYFYMTGEWPIEVDHDDGNGLNNKWDNIFNVTRTKNSMNHRLHSDNTSGHVGVNWFKRVEKWTACITVKKNQIHLGYFVDWFEAVCVRKSAENRYGFHKNHGSVRPL